MTDRSILETIRSWDPDGKPQRPTKNDYIAFHMAVIAEYGPQAWKDYCQEWAGGCTYE